jgi:hypothetical protein
MVETIAPVVHGGRRSRYWFALALHVLGATASAAALGALLGAAGSLADAPWGAAGAVAVALVAAAYALRELIGLRVPLPHLRRQVPEWWRTFFSPPAAAFLYGVGLGVGFLTFLAGGALVTVAVAAFTSGSPLAGAALCGPFGLARGIVLVVGRRAAGPDGASDVLARVERAARTPLRRTANGVALALVAAAALAVAL